MHPSKLLLIVFVSVMAILLSSHTVFGDNLSIVPHIELEQEYTNNIFFTPSYVKPTNDAITLLNSGLELNLSNELDRLGLNGNIKNISYHDNRDLSATDLLSEARISHIFTPRTSFDSSLQYNRDSSPDRDIETTGLILDTTRRDFVHYDLKTMHSLSELMMTDLTYTFESQKFDSTKYTDSDSRSLDLGSTIDAGSLLEETQLRMDILYEQYKYPNSLLEKTENYECHIGATRKMDELLNLTFYIGTRYTTTKYSAPYLFWLIEEKSRSKGLVGLISMEYQTELANTKVSLSHNLENVSGSTALTNRSSARFDATVSFSETLASTISAEYILNRTDKGNGTTQNINQQTVNIQPSVRVKLADDFFLSVSNIHTFLRDIENHTMYRRNLFSISLEYRHSFFN